MKFIKSKLIFLMWCMCTGSSSSVGKTYMVQAHSTPGTQYKVKVWHVLWVSNNEY